MLCAGSVHARKQSVRPNFVISVCPFRTDARTPFIRSGVVRKAMSTCQKRKQQELKLSIICSSDGKFVVLHSSDDSRNHANGTRRQRAAIPGTSEAVCVAGETRSVHERFIHRATESCRPASTRQWMNFRIRIRCYRCVYAVRSLAVSFSFVSPSVTRGTQPNYTRITGTSLPWNFLFFGAIFGFRLYLIRQIRKSTGVSEMTIRMEWQAEYIIFSFGAKQCNFKSSM